MQKMTPSCYTREYYHVFRGAAGFQFSVWALREADRWIDFLSLEFGVIDRQTDNGTGVFLFTPQGATQRCVVRIVSES